MHRKMKSMCQQISRKVQSIDKGRLLYTAFLIPTAVVAVPVRAYAADTVWTTQRFHSISVLLLLNDLST